MAKLGEVFKLQMGKTPSRNNSGYWQNGKYKWVSIADLGGYKKYTENTKERITEFAVSDTGIKSVPANTVIMSFKLSLGKTAITKEIIFTNEAIMAFIPNDNFSIIPDYFYYLFSGMDWTKETRRAVMGATLNKDTLSKITVSVPPLEEQEKIAMVLDKVTDLIDKRKQQLAKLDELIKSRFVEMFGDPVTNPNGYNKEQLKNITHKIGSGSTPKGGKESYHTEGISLIRSLNVHNGKFEYKDLAYINELQAKQLNNVIVEEQDVLLNITGASVARSCVVPKDILPARVNQHVTIIRCKIEELNPIFLNQQLLNASYQNFLIFLGESNGATRQALTKEQIENFYIIIPPLDLQNKFAEFVEQTEKTKVAINHSLDKLETLKKALMQKYFG